MWKIATTLFFIYLSIIVKGQTQISASPFISIDHIPIVVKDLDSIKKVLSTVASFKIKEGREHEGIRNCFIKFQDGTYLEFTTPVDTLHAIGKYYTERLKQGQGGTSLAISVTNAAAVTTFLISKSIAFEVDSNRIWKTVSPKQADLFFIDYQNKSWKDTEVNTTHPNKALSLQSTYILSDNLKKDIHTYTSFGFKQSRKGVYLDLPYTLMVIGNSKLYLLDASQSKKLPTKFNVHNLRGICGFEIEVSSLASLNKLLPKTENVFIESTQTLFFLKEYHIFFVFSEKGKK